MQVTGSDLNDAIPYEVIIYIYIVPGEVPKASEGLQFSNTLKQAAS